MEAYVRRTSDYIVIGLGTCHRLTLRDARSISFAIGLERALAVAESKPTFEEYVAKVMSLGSESERAKAETLYAFNMRSAQSAAQREPYVGLVKTLRSLPANYLNGDTELLFYPREVPDDLRLKVKPFDSVVIRAEYP